MFGDEGIGGVGMRCGRDGGVEVRCRVLTAYRLSQRDYKRGVTAAEGTEGSYG